jgi:hypothetical protein
VIGGLAAIVLVVVGVLVFVNVLTQGGTTLAVGRSGAQHACALVYQWEASAGYNGTHDTSLPGDVNLLDQAVAAAFRSESSSQPTLSLQTDLTVLLHQVQMEHRRDSFTNANLEQSIQIDCRQLGHHGGPSWVNNRPLPVEGSKTAAS